MIYKVGLREEDDTKVFTYLHVEADSIPEAVQIAEDYAFEEDEIHLIASEVSETRLKIIGDKK